MADSFRTAVFSLRSFSIPFNPLSTYCVFCAHNVCLHCIYVGNAYAVVATQSKLATDGHVRDGQRIRNDADEAQTTKTTSIAVWKCIRSIAEKRVEDKKDEPNTLAHRTCGHTHTPSNHHVF